MDDRTRRQQRHDQLAGLVRGFASGTISRRDFTTWALALGLSMPVVGTLLTTYGAGAAPRPVAHPSAGVARQEATPGGTLRFARAEDSVNMDPVTNDGNRNLWVFMNVYDQLVRVTLDGADLEPALAESWDISDDGTTYTFHIRQGVLFSDGTPLKASDVVYSLTRAANDPAQTWTFTLTALQRDASGQVQGITAPDDATVVVTLAQPWAPFLSDLAMFNLSIVSEAFASGQEERLVDEMMGTGPFVFAEWRKGESILLTKNSNYWEEGLPLLDEVLISVVPDDNSRILQLQGGEIDAMYNVPNSRVEDIRSDPNLQVIEFPSTASSYITLNHRVAPLDDVNVRLALQYATDKQTLIEVVLFGLGEEATSLMPKGALFWNSELPGFPFNLDTARERLAASAVPDGFSIEMSILGGSVTEETLATALKDMWSQIGVDVQINPVDQAAHFDHYNNREFQTMVNGWTNDIIDPDELISYAIFPESSEAFGTGWSNQEAIDLARQGAAELDPAKRQEAYYRIQEIYNEEAVMILLYHTPYLDAMTKQVHDFGHPPTGQWVWKKTWIEE